MIKILKAVKEDLRDIYEVEKLCFMEGIGYSLEKLTEKFNKAKDRFYVVRDGDDIVSYFWTECWDDRINKDPMLQTMKGFMRNSVHDEENGKYALYIANVCVIPRMRGRGIAKACLEFMLKNLHEFHFAILAVESNNIGAKKLYESFGFETIHTIENYYSAINDKTFSGDIMVKKNKEKCSNDPKEYH